MTTKTAAYDVARVRRDFPILSTKVHGKPLVYLDNAATTQKPSAVINAISTYYEAQNSNVHRGVHHLSELATKLFEQARVKAARFVGAADAHEIVFVRGATEAINLVASSYLRPIAKPGDEVVISAMEHHSNIVPWQMLRDEKGIVLKIIPMNDAGELDLAAFVKLLGPKTRLVCVNHVSNALGTVNPVKRIIDLAHEKEVPVLVDGAQAAPHLAVDVKALDADFYALSGHKMYGPTGIGLLYAKAAHLEAMSPYQGGGDMILSVTFEKTVYNRIPYKFEAGTPDIAGAVGLGAAIDYLGGIGLDAVAAHEHELLEYATAKVAKLPGVRLIGTAAEKAGVLSFVMEGAHPHDVGTIVDQMGIAIRTGHHCAQPVMDRFGIPATVRASFGLYNTAAEVDALVAAIGRVREVMGL